jgi:hypothetical protein
MAIHGFQNMDIYAACLFGWMKRAIFLFDWIDERGWEENS